MEVFYTARGSPSGFFPSFLLVATTRGREKSREREPGYRKRKVTESGSGGREKSGFGGFVPSSWPGTAKEALSCGCSFGQCLLFLPLSLFFAALPPLSPRSPLFVAPFTFTSLAVLPLFHSSPHHSRAASHTRDTVCRSSGACL